MRGSVQPGSRGNEGLSHDERDVAIHRNILTNVPTCSTRRVVPLPPFTRVYGGGGASWVRNSSFFANSMFRGQTFCGEGSVEMGKESGKYAIWLVCAPGSDLTLVCAQWIGH